MKMRMAAASTAAVGVTRPIELGEVVGIYRLGAKIGAGSFGEIYLAADIQTGEKYAAKLVNFRVISVVCFLKLLQEALNTKNPQLLYEYKVYKGIKKGMGVPKVHFYGVTPTHNVMILDLLGQSLEGLFNICSVCYLLMIYLQTIHCDKQRQFSLKTILMLAIQLVSILVMI